MTNPTEYTTPDGDTVRLIRPAHGRPDGHWLVDHVHPESGRRRGRITVVDLDTCTRTQR